MNESLAAWLHISRLPFLLGGLVMNALGTAFALAEGAPFDLWTFAAVQAVITATQLANHLANEYYDRDVDAQHTARHRPQWSGGSGVLPEGRLPAESVRRAALILLALATIGALSITAFVRPGAWTATLLAASITVAWFYSAPPLTLHGSGWGEVLGALLLAGWTPLLGYHMQGGSRIGATLGLLLPLIALQSVMLIVVSLPDAAGDALGGKRTLAVRLSPRRTARLATFLLAVAYGWSFFRLRGAPPAPIVATCTLAGAPLAAWLATQLWTDAGTDPRRWNRLAFWTIGLVVGTASATALALVVAFFGH